VRCSALNVIEAVLTSAGAMLPPSLRTLADAAVAEAAAAAASAATSGPTTSLSAEAGTATAVAAREAAYTALLASVLSPRPFRPTNLPLAAAIFRRARGRDPALSVFAARALLAIEAVLHPAAPPLHPRAIAPPPPIGGGMHHILGEAASWGDGDRAGAQQVSWGAGGSGPSWGDAEDEDEEEEEEVAPPAKLTKKARAAAAAAAAAAEAEGDEVDEEDEENVAVGVGGDDWYHAAGPAGTVAPEPAAGLASSTDLEMSLAEPVETAPAPAAKRAARRGKDAADAAAPAPARAPPAGMAAKKPRGKASKVGPIAVAPDVAPDVALVPVRVGLGNGKAAVAVQLSDDDDSDGELPDIVDDDGDEDE
jgi:hypothetical protein